MAGSTSKNWRRFLSWKVLLAVGGIGTLAMICGVGVAYALTPVPKVNADAVSQGTTIYYAKGNGKGEILGRIGASRQIVPLSQISASMQAATLAAEDRNFYHEPAISPTGIARAIVNDLSGGDTQGGSTITQQYVKNAYLNQDRTFSRKFKELFVAIKIGKQQKKEDILANYLNTIYFGPDAYSVEAAARVYFGTTAAKLDVPQSALLAANIKQPGYYVPSKDPRRQADTVARYNYVLDGMVTMGKLSAADAAKYKDHLPTVKRFKPAGSAYRGQSGFLLTRVQNVLRNLGYTDQEIATGGLKVYTTWDKDLQEKAAAAVENKLRGTHMPSNTRVGLVSINPNNGEVLAAYGGEDYARRQVDDAFYSTAQVGSSFKPYVLAAALEQNIGLKSKMDATTPAYIDPQGDRVAQGTNGSFPVHNDEGNAANPIVDLITATQMSYNTVYVPLGYKAGTDNVMQLAERSGFPAEKLAPHKGEEGLFIGQADASPLVQAGGYATIANDGEYIRPHIIRSVKDSQGHTFHPERLNKYRVKQQAFRADVARDVQYAMQSVVRSPGTGFRAALPGRQVAGKTGTTDENKSAWFVGFTPKQLVTAVGMWRFDDAITKGKHKRAARYFPLQNVGGLARVNGGDYPAQIWHDYMSSALEGKPVTQFEPPAWVGETRAYATPSPPPPSQDPTPLPPCQLGQDPARDHCKPDFPNPPHSRFCNKHPNAPICHQPTPPPDPGSTCKPPFINCPTTPPPNDPGGGTGPNDVQGKAARPIRE